MRSIAVISIFLALLFVFSCSQEGYMRERTIIQYVDVDTSIKQKGKDKVKKKKKITAVSSRKKAQYNLMFDEIVREMNEKGILPGDLGTSQKDYKFLKRSIDNESFRNFSKRHRKLLKTIIDMRIGQSFVQDKYRRLRDTVNTVDPGGKNLMDIESKIISAEQLMQERKWELANRVINELFTLLGK